MTIQVKDTIIIEGVKYYLYVNPLDSYWNKKNPKPIIRLTRTSCWRGYSATWEIMDNFLYLIDIMFYSSSGDLGMDYFFPKKEGRVLATWFNGDLIIPIGKIIYSEILEDDIFETDWFIIIKHGKIIKERFVVNS